jgi:hypothetical protein
LEKEHFLDLAKNFTALSAEDARAVDALQQTYPYSQVVHCLASRGARDHQFKNANALLALSAVYATDRAILKTIMTAARTERAVASEYDTDDHEPELSSVLAPAPEVIQALREADGLSGDALVEEVLMDLNRLQELKRLFEDSFDEFRGAQTTSPRKSPTVERPVTTVKKPLPLSPAPVVQPKVIAKAKQNDLPVPEPSSELLLNEIATTRKPVLPETKKQKEQLQIIDQFITKQPSISKPKPLSVSDAADLAEKAVSLTDSLVSETLVEILLRQGKKDKAIEVLRKLIWKFPQKKAIFAAQIEDLRK